MYIRVYGVGADLPLDIIMQQDIIPNLVEGVKCNRPNIQLECLWILNNLATGNEEQVRILVFYSIIDTSCNVFRDFTHFTSTIRIYKR